MKKEWIKIVVNITGDIKLHLSWQLKKLEYGDSECNKY